MDKKAAKKNAIKIKLIAAYKEIFSSPQGKLVFNDLLKRVAYFGSACEANPHFMYYKTGRKDVVNDIITICDQDPSKLLDQFREYEKEQRDYENSL